MSDGKRIFSEGVTVTYHANGTYSVVDAATGLPIYGVRGVEITAETDGLFGGRRNVVEVDIDTMQVKCTLRFENVETD